MNDIHHHLHVQLRFPEIISRELSLHSFSVTYRKPDRIQAPNSKWTKVFYLQEGLIRHFKIADRKQITTGFSMPGGFITDGFPLHANERQSEGLAPEKDSVCIEIQKEAFIGLEEEHPEICMLYDRLRLHTLQVKSQDFEGLYRHSADSRFRYVVEKYPYLFQEASRQHLQNFIGIGNDNFQRLRKEYNIPRKQPQKTQKRSPEDKK